MKKRLTLLLTLLLALTGCGSQTTPADDAPAEIHVFAAASLTESLNEIIAQYPGDVTILPTYDSSGKLLTQIQEGAPCDLFLSAAPKQMDALEEEGALLDGSRVDLLQNKVVLAVPEGNPAQLQSFDDLARRLTEGDILLAIGNSDVPVGQYTQKIFSSYDLDETALSNSGVLTYGSNVKEVTTQVSEGLVDGGIIYATDASTAGLTVVDEATAEQCGQVLYPAAVLNGSAAPEAASAFLAYLQEAQGGMETFQSFGFSPAD